MVMHGGHCDRRGIEFEVGGKKFVNRSEDGDCEIFASFGRTQSLGLDGGNERNRLAEGFEFAIDTKVIAAKGAGSGDRDSRDGTVGYCAAPLPSTALRQRP